MDLSRPLAVITPTLDAPVLAVLARSGLSLSGREVHRLAGTGSASGVHKVLRRLVRQGIVIADARPSETLYELNREHLAAEAVDRIVRIPETLIDHLRHALRSWVPAPRHASAFRSFARGEAGGDSDVDLLLVRPARAAASWEDGVLELQGQVRAMTGNALEVLEWSLSELRAQRRTSLWRQLLSDSILLAGQPLERVVSTAR